MSTETPRKCAGAGGKCEERARFEFDGKTLCESCCLNAVFDLDRCIESMLVATESPRVRRL